MGAAIAGSCMGGLRRSLVSCSLASVGYHPRSLMRGVVRQERPEHGNIWKKMSEEVEQITGLGGIFG